MIIQQSRKLSQGCQLCGKMSKSPKGKGHSSHSWLQRQLKDPYVEKAKMQNYRCRSAFKLIEINEKYSILHPGQCIIDVGAAPGSWTQVAVSKTGGADKDGNQALIIAVDRQSMHPLDGAIMLGNYDFTRIETQGKIKGLLKGRSPDLILSDMAPNATGIRHLDHEIVVALVYSVIRFALVVTRVGGSLLVKLWEGKEIPKIEEDLRRFYRSVRFVKPPSSRSDSAEMYILSKEFVGIQTP